VLKYTAAPSTALSTVIGGLPCGLMLPAKKKGDDNNEWHLPGNILCF